MLDYSTPSAKTFVQQMFVFAEFVRSTSKESWATAQRHAVERGIHISPNGYFGVTKAAGRLVPNGDAPEVGEVFRRRGQGESWGALADYQRGCTEGGGHLDGPGDAAIVRQARVGR